MAEENETKTKIKSLRTYQGDIEEILAKGKASASTILIAEQKRKEEDANPLKEPVDNRARNKYFIILGITLFLLGASTLSVIYYIKSIEKVSIIQKTKAIISFSAEKQIPLANLNRDGLLTKIIAEKESFKLPVNSILYLNTVNQQNNPESVGNILSLLSPKMPAQLSRSFENKYMIGVYSFDTNEPFVILTTNDYAGSYAGMLKWEKDMQNDLGKLFGIPQNTSTVAANFYDEALKNKDLRILKGDDGKTVLLYSFIDKNTLVITANRNVLTSIIGKYLINKSAR